MKKYFYYIPILVFLCIVLFFGRQLFLNEDPSHLPSVLIDKKFPNIEFKKLEQYKLLKVEEVFSHSRPSIVNVWSSWCVPCKVEHPNLMLLKNKYSIRIYGINYKDNMQEAKKLLEFSGNPFYSIGIDASGLASIDLGVYGVPETFILDGKGKIRYRHVGPILKDDLNNTILPILKKIDNND